MGPCTICAHDMCARGCVAHVCLFVWKNLLALECAVMMHAHKRINGNGQHSFVCAMLWCRADNNRRALAQNTAYYFRKHIPIVVMGDGTTHTPLHTHRSANPQARFIKLNDFLFRPSIFCTRSQPFRRNARAMRNRRCRGHKFNYVPLAGAAESRVSDFSRV